jgi:hypothetical protein
VASLPCISQGLLTEADAVKAVTDPSIEIQEGKLVSQISSRNCPCLYMLRFSSSHRDSETPPSWSVPTSQPSPVCWLIRSCVINTDHPLMNFSTKWPSSIQLHFPCFSAVRHALGESLPLFLILLNFPLSLQHYLEYRVEHPGKSSVMADTTR